MSPFVWCHIVILPTLLCLRCQDWSYLPNILQQQTNTIEVTLLYTQTSIVSIWLECGFECNDFLAANENVWGPPPPVKQKPM